MGDKTIQILKKTIPYVISLIAGLYLIVLITGSFMGFAKYKLDISTQFSQIIKNIAIHPISYYLQYLQERNPLTLILSGVLIMYIVFFALKRARKESQWETADTDTHGSATWGTLKEITDQYFIVSPNGLETDFKKNIDINVIQKLNEKGQ